MKLHRLERISLLLVIIVFSLILTSALLWPPNTWDSMTYHMSRVYQWLSRGSLAHFPAGTDRQNELGPLAEILILNLYGLMNYSDRFSNLIQFFSSVGSFFILNRIYPHIAEKFELKQRGYLIAGILFLSAPMIVLQSSSTQNDLVSTFFVLIGIERLIDAIKSFKFSWATWIESGLGFGFSFLVKPVAILLLGPLIIYFYLLFVRTNLQKNMFGICLLLGVFITVQVPHGVRNYHHFGNALGSEAVRRTVKNETLSPFVLTANLIRNSALHLVLPVSGLKLQLEKEVRKAVSGLGVDPDDFKYSMTKTYFEIPNLDEDHAGNFILFFLFLFFSIGLCLFYKKDRFWLGLFTLSLWLGLAIFSLLLKWQPWHSRLMTPWFAGVSLMVAIGLLRFKFLERTVPTLMLLCSLPWVLLNLNRPLITNFWTEPRSSGYFQKKPQLYQGFTAMGKIIQDSGCQNIATCTSGDSWEYPLMQLSKSLSTDKAILFFDVLRNAASTSTSFCGVIVFDEAPCPMLKGANPDYRLVSGYGHELWIW